MMAQAEARDAEAEAGPGSPGVAPAEEPVKKRPRLDEPGRQGGSGGAGGGGVGGANSNKLEERLYSVLCCTVCLDLPKASIFQCSNGHLMCAGCFIHLLADARLKEEQATCPNCRCEISKSLCCRNLAVEKAVSELPAECGFCLHQFPRSCLEHHQKELCQDRLTNCRYQRIGCPWQGPFHEISAHEAECCHPKKTGSELMGVLDEMDQNHKKEMQLFNDIFTLLSLEKIGYTEVQFRPYRTDDFITRLYYETPRFNILNQTWVLKGRVNDSERNPNLSCKRALSFQLNLKSKLSSPMECAFLLLRGPYDDARVTPVVHYFTFTNEGNETEYLPLPIVSAVECNKLLAAKNINLRLFMFHVQK
ncbi:zinc finger TRAF-type-containing protein 1 isoform X2 [Petromyzon marinus]|uniref:zinc finger TRAF-type-containing protein 1 isoform X2 n=1 Tax=Petromyzon marinus TaxID=7757 RepID=UPI003F6F910E